MTLWKQTSWGFCWGKSPHLLQVLLFVAFTRTYTRLPGNGTGAFRQMIWYHWYSVQHGGGWRALMSAVGFLCLPLFFVVTLISALFGGGGGAEEVAGIYDPCAGAICSDCLGQKFRENIISIVFLNLDQSIYTIIQIYIHKCMIIRICISAYISWN